MLSKTCEYAIRAMIYVAKQSQNGKVVNIKEIAANIDSPELFVGKILQGLSKQGLLHSQKGRNGGFFISDAGSNISLADIIIAIDGEKIFTGCGVGLDHCSEKNPCPIHHEYKPVRKLFHDMYKQTTLAQFKNSLKGNHILLKRS